MAKSLWLAGLLSVVCGPLHAQNQTINGNLTVTGSIEAAGSIDAGDNTLTFGTQGSGFGGALLHQDNSTDTFTFFSNRNPASWLWQHTVGIAAMRLDANHQLILYQADGTTAGVTLAPASNSIKLGTHANGTLTADSNGVITAGGGFAVAGGITNTNGTLTGGVTGLTLNAGGTNQNITLSSSGTGDLVFNTNGIERARIKSTGYVGIGTTVPANKLTVAGVHGDTQFRLFSDHYGQGENGANTALLSLWASEPNWSWTGTGIGNNIINSGSGIARVSTTRGGSYIRLLDNQIALNAVDSTGADRSAIFINVGNVGVGTTNPQSRLEVDGGVEPLFVRNGGASRLFLGVNQTGGGYGRIGVFDDSIPGWKNLILAEGGNVGIGTTSPGYKLDVTSAVSASPITNGVLRIVGTGSNPATGTGGGLLFAQQDSTGTYGSYASITGRRKDNAANNFVDLDFNTGSPLDSIPLATRMTITANGNVGIGTSNPLRALGINGGIMFQIAGGAARSLHWADETTGNAPILISGNSTSGNECLTFSTNTFGNWGLERMRITATGNVGIGTTNPPQQLSLTGGIGFANQNAADKKLYSPADGVLEWMTNQYATVHGFSVSHQGEQRVFLNTNGNSFLNGGNVGIGTTSPSHKLAVAGTIRAQEIIVDNTNWADYVFEEDYRLAPLAEVESHIKATKHLPGIPSATEVAERGVSMGEMQAKLLSKVEELTLHLIRMEKENSELRQRVLALESVSTHP